MTFYQSEIIRIRKTCYANEWQLATVIAVRNYIDENFDQQLNLGLLSRLTFTSRFHLIRLFKRYYGLTPKQYLIDRRIQKAKEFLKARMSVTDTCFSVGFECPASFSTLFKSRVGVAPAAFQKRQFSQSGAAL